MEDTTVAQVSFGPAIQQTVTTVTTTTSVSLPPLVIHPPKHLDERDPKQYPLAFSPTPAYLKRFCTDIHGQPIRFVEGENARATIRKHEALRAKIERSQGAIRSEEKQDGYYTPTRSFDGQEINPTIHNVRASAAPKRTATPPSIAEAAELASLQRMIKKPRSHAFRPSAAEPMFNQQSPFTPDPDAALAAAGPLKSSHSKSRLKDMQSIPDDEGAEVQAENRRPALPFLDTSSQLDASLPSPSLSPIRAAASLASLGNNPQHVPPPVNGPTLMDVPTMISAFDNMPETMQSYLIYQFLRRCAKPTLQMVANVVNPALKCDPFNMLPVELGMQIIHLLDVQSMCRAAQVSKRWRKHINSDEKAWKDLLERDGFVLPDGEIARAVKEGWGWQHTGEDGYEEDLSKQVQRSTPEPHVPSSPPGITVISDDEEAASSGHTARIKRKSILKHVSVAKKLKRRSVQVSASATKPSSTMSSSARTSLHRDIRAAKGGPNALANVAASAIPNPTTGLDSLRGMHLFKSLYQRHYLIRKSWMQEDSQPQHLAFRAHHRHVVTCLLFDGEKILTGSDDTKINVYDTKTGALKNRLEGHEGGVWALQYEGDTLVSGSTDRSVRVWDIKSGRCLQVFQGHTSTVRCLVILKPVQIDTAPDGTPIMMPKEPLIITGSRDSTLRVWKLPQPGDRQVFHAGPPARDTDNPYFLRTLSGHHNSVRAIAAHGDTLISGSYDCTVRVWKISNGDLVHRLQGHTQKVYSVVLDTARNRCISGSMDNLVKVWDLTSGACLFNLEGHTSLVGLLDLSHDRLVSAAADSTLRIWDPESGTCKATLSAHTGAITCFQHDGQKVISGSDRTLKMWNVRNGECVKDLLTDLSGVWQVRFDERRCVAAVQRHNLTYIEVSTALLHLHNMHPS